ncbi:hypothetical protein PIB30_100418 [Stylosanthes scabra]|uniref:Uncharacterized protein n=1 Tax=Stylosanthes scabra TaxID=79078 RepID=A0ABU6RXT1_9FABA|nr:hypothetical protein [Stylosanthes scabra]
MSRTWRPNVTDASRVSSVSLLPPLILLDSSAGGPLQLKIPEEAMELIELVANNQYMFTSDRCMKMGVMEVDTMDAILAQNKAIAQQLTNLNKKIEKLEVASMGTQGET